MATRKRTTTAKSVEKSVVEEVKPIVVEEISKTVADKPTTTKKQKRVFQPDDGIPCRSIVQGGLFMEGVKTKMLYEWVEYGDITYVEYADLASAVRVRSNYVFGPCFMIDDDDFIEEFPQLKKFYTENYTQSDLEDILTYPVEKMLEEINMLPKSAIESLKVLAAADINEGKLDSVAKIKALDEVFGTQLSILAEFK